MRATERPIAKLSVRHTIVKTTPLSEYMQDLAIQYQRNHGRLDQPDETAVLIDSDDPNNTIYRIMTNAALHELWQMGASAVPAMTPAEAMTTLR